MSTTTARPAAAKGAVADGAEPAPAKSKLKLVLAAVLVLALVGGAGWFFLLRGDGKPVAAEKGTVLPVDAININLTGGHYLKLGFALQLTKDTTENPDPSEALALAIDQFSGADMAGLGKAKHRREALDKFSKAVIKAYPHEVMEVYPTTFVMQ